MYSLHVLRSYDEEGGREREERERERRERERETRVKSRIKLR